MSNAVEAQNLAGRPAAQQAEVKECTASCAQPRGQPTASLPPVTYLWIGCQDAEKSKFPNPPKPPSISVNFFLLLTQHCGKLVRLISLQLGEISILCKTSLSRRIFCTLHAIPCGLIINKWAWLCPNKTFFTKTSCRTERALRM